MYCCKTEEVSHDWQSFHNPFQAFTWDYKFRLMVLQELLHNQFNILIYFTFQYIFFFLHKALVSIQRTENSILKLLMHQRKHSELQAINVIATIPLTITWFLIIRNNSFLHRAFASCQNYYFNALIRVRKFGENVSFVLQHQRARILRQIKWNEFFCSCNEQLALIWILHLISQETCFCSFASFSIAMNFNDYAL